MADRVAQFRADYVGLRILHILQAEVETEFLEDACTWGALPIEPLPSLCRDRSLITRAVIFHAPAIGRPAARVAAAATARVTAAVVDGSRGLHPDSPVTVTLTLSPRGLGLSPPLLVRQGLQISQSAEVG